MAKNTFYGDLAFSNANGVRIAHIMILSGDPSSKPLLLIMGLAGQMIIWDAERAFNRGLIPDGIAR